MHVGFDTTALFSGTTGVARYVRELATALERQGIHLSRFAIGRAPHADGAAIAGAGRRVRVPLRVVHQSWSLLHLPSADWLAPSCDVVHSPALVPPPSPRPLVVTVHDLDALTRPELHSRRARVIQRAQLAAARDRASVVLTVSNATADALCERGVDTDRIVVAPNAVTLFPSPDNALVPDGPYLLAVGALGSRKGLDVLVAGFARSSISDVRLVLAGPDGWGAGRVLTAIERHGVADRVIRTGAVSDAQLAGLYAHCLALCFPSRAEGFGLPVLEAGAAGAAVVASDLGATREIGAGVAIYVAVDDEQAWSEALERIVADDSLRSESGAKGRAFAGGFTWDRTATITASAYMRALEGR